MTNPDRVQGNFFGISAFVVALMFFAVAILDGEHWWRLAWIGAVSGWGLTGLGMIKMGEERAKKNSTSAAGGKMTKDELLLRAIDLLCGATSGFIPGTMPDVEWCNLKDKLLRDHREYKDANQQRQK